MAILCQNRPVTPGGKSTSRYCGIFRVSCGFSNASTTFHKVCSCSLTVDRRIEYLTLAVNNAKSHPSSEFGRHETAVEFLTDLEEKLEVAQVQREICHKLAAKLGNPQGEDAMRLRHLENKLLNITQVRCISDGHSQHFYSSLPVVR